jgi:hypothetical protein
MKKMFKANKTIMHLDMSHNGWESKELNKMTEGMKSNHKILGIHMMGNACDTDALGYVNKKKETDVAKL